MRILSRVDLLLDANEVLVVVSSSLKAIAEVPINFGQAHSMGYP